MFGRGWHGMDGPRERVFEKGALKYVTLDLLAERPRHGYDVIQALEQRMQGGYSPSPGSVYPILQMLEDMGHVTAEAKEGRKVYTLTEAGRAFLAENRTTVDEIWARAEGTPDGHSPGDLHRAFHDLRFEFKELAEFVSRRSLHRHLNPEKMRRVHEVIARARQEIEAILRE